MQVAEFGVQHDELMAKSRAWLQRMREGVNPSELAQAEAAASVETAVPTMEELLERYIQTRGDRLRSSSATTYRKVLKFYFGDWLDRSVDELRVADVVEVHQRILDAGKSPATANVLIAILRTLMAFAVDLELIEKSPVERFKRMRLSKASPVRTNTLTSETLPKWMKAVRQYPGEFPFSVVVQLALLTGARRSEILGMTWDEVEWGRGGGSWTIPAERSKTHKARVIPFTKEVSKLMRRARDVTDGVNARSKKLRESKLVFFKNWDGAFPVKKPMRDVDAYLRKIAAETGVTITLHDLRRTWNSVAVLTEGVPEVVRKMVMGHSLGGDTNLTHYVQIETDDIRRAMQRVEDRLLAIAQG